MENPWKLGNSSCSEIGSAGRGPVLVPPVKIELNINGFRGA